MNNQRRTRLLVKLAGLGIIADTGVKTSWGKKNKGFKMKLMKPRAAKPADMMSVATTKVAPAKQPTLKPSMSLPKQRPVG